LGLSGYAGREPEIGRGRTSRALLYNGAERLRQEICTKIGTFSHGAEQKAIGQVMPVMAIVANCGKPIPLASFFFPKNQGELNAYFRPSAFNAKQY